MKTRCVAPLLALCLLVLCPQHPSAHPLAQGRMEAIVSKEKITLWVRVAVEEVLVQMALAVDEKTDQYETTSDAYKSHGTYLLKHIFLKADGVLLQGKILSVQDPDNKTIHPLDSVRQFATYEIEYPLAAVPKTLELSQNVLNEIEYMPGNKWEASYITGITLDSKTTTDDFLLSNANTLKYDCVWNAPEPAKPVNETPAPKSEPPAALHKPAPEPPSEVWKFAAGLFVGALAIVLIAWLLKRRAPSSP